VAGQTAAELISDPANPALPNMGLQTWSGSRVRKDDVTVAKNYLEKGEMEELDRFVVMYLERSLDNGSKREGRHLSRWPFTVTRKVAMANSLEAPPSGASSKLH